MVQLLKCCSAGWGAGIAAVPLGTDVGREPGLTPAEGATCGMGYPEGTTGVWDTMGGNGIELPKVRTVLHFFHQVCLLGV